MIEQKMPSDSRKVTTCTECKKTFWYIDPRLGGRPRQKCGICSSRPPRYPWGFLEASQGDHELQEVTTTTISHAPTIEHSELHYEHSDGVDQADGVLSAAYVMPSSNYMNSVSNEEDFITNEAVEEKLMWIQQQFTDISVRLSELEKKVDTLRSHSVLRSDWIDLSARLDIVENSMVETLGKVRNRLNTFTKEVKQIAVVPERELGEMFELVRMIRRYLGQSGSGNK